MRIWFLIGMGIWSVWASAQTLNRQVLEREIIDLSRQEKYEEAIEKLQRIVLDPSRSALDKAEAYFLKHEIYSRIGIYTEAESNLTWFREQAAISSANTDEYNGRFHLATAILSCKRLDYQEGVSLLAEIRPYSTSYTSMEYALYLFLEGIQQIEDENYNAALVNLKESIQRLEAEASDYLPMAYKELLRLYGRMEEHDQVLQAYETGMAHGETLRVISEVFQLYRFMADYYKSIGLNKESLALSDKILVLSTAYNAPQISSKLHVVEKKVLEERKVLDKQQAKKIQRILIGSVLVLGGLLLWSFRAYQHHKKKKVWVEQENRTLKINVTNLKEEKKKMEEEPHVLTERQGTILALVKEGKTNKEIAANLCISENTVKYHLKIIYDHLQIKGRSELK